LGGRAAKVGREDQLMMMMITIIIITIGYRVIVSRSLLLVPLFLSTWRGEKDWRLADTASSQVQGQREGIRKSGE
jgi:hypothetical protein